MQLCSSLLRITMALAVLLNVSFVGPTANERHTAVPEIFNEVALIPPLRTPRLSILPKAAVVLAALVIPVLPARPQSVPAVGAAHTFVTAEAVLKPEALPKALRHVSPVDLTAIEKLPPLQREAFRRALRSREFADFYAFMQKNYPGSPSGQLAHLLEVYLNPAGAARFRDPRTIEAYARMRAHFTHVRLDILAADSLDYFGDRDSTGLTDDYYGFHAMMTTPDGRRRYEQNLARAAAELQEIKARFNLPVDGPSSDLQLFAASKDLRMAMLDRNHGPLKGSDVYQYFRDHYPQCLPLGLTAGQLGVFYQTFALPILKLGLPPSELDKMLNVFGLNISQVNLHDAYVHLNQAGLDTHKESAQLLLNLHNGTFEHGLKTLGTAYPIIPKTLSSLVSEGADGNLKNISMLWPLVASFARAKEFDQLWALTNALSPRLIPIFDMSNFELKRQIFSEVLARWPHQFQLTHQVTGFQLELLTRQHFDREALTRILARLRDGTAQSVLDALHHQWSVPQPELNAFFAVLSTDKLLSFVSNKENATAYQTISRQLKLFHLDAVKQSFVPEMTLEDIITCGPVWVRAADNRYLGNIVLGLAFLEPEWQITDATTKPPVRHYVAAAGIEMARFSSIQDPNFVTYVNRLRQFGFSSEEIRKWLTHIDNYFQGDLETTKTALDDPQTPARFFLLQQFFRRQFPSRSIDRLALLRVVLLSNPTPATMVNGLRQLSGLGYPIDQEATLDYVFRHIFSVPDILKTLNSADFADFYHSLQGQFLDGQPPIENVPELCQLFNEVSRTPRDLGLLKSRKFKKLQKVIRVRWNINQVNLQQLLPLLHLAKQINARQLEEFLDRYPYPTSAGDLYLIAAILNDRELERRFRDREQMISDVWNLVYRQAPLTRTALDGVSTLEMLASKRRDAGESDVDIQARIQRLKKEYNDRPDPATLPSLELLRLLLLHEALQSSDFQAEVGRAMAADLKDRSTEYGGIITFGHGKYHLLVYRGLRAAEDPSGMLGQPNNQYSASFDPYLFEGLMPIHFHIEFLDSRVYSGPSGWAGGHRGDIGVSIRTGGVAGAVIASLGYSKDPKGRADPSRLRVLTKMYFAREPQGTATIVDVGQSVVPTNAPREDKSTEQAHPKPSSTLNQSYRIIVPLLIVAFGFALSLFSHGHHGSHDAFATASMGIVNFSWMGRRLADLFRKFMDSSRPRRSATAAAA